MFQIALYVIGAGIAFLFAYFLSQFHLWQGQWAVERARGRGPKFRSGLLQRVMKQGKKLRWSTTFLPVYALVTIQNRTAWSFWHYTAVILPLFVVGLCIGMGRGFLSAPPARRATTLSVTIVALVSCWLIGTNRLQFPEWVIKAVSAAVVIILAANGLAYIKARLSRPQNLVMDLGQLGKRDLRAEILLKDGSILSVPPTLTLHRLVPGSLAGVIGDLKVMLTPQGLDIALIQPDPELPPDSQYLPGIETREISVLWIHIGSESIRFDNKQKMIGYSESTFILKNSKARLHLNGPGKKREQMINAWSEDALPPISELPSMH